MRLNDADHLIQIVCGATILPDGFKNVFRNWLPESQRLTAPPAASLREWRCSLDMSR